MNLNWDELESNLFTITPSIGIRKENPIEEVIGFLSNEDGP